MSQQSPPLYSDGEDFLNGQLPPLAVLEDLDDVHFDSGSDFDPSDFEDEDRQPAVPPQPAIRGPWVVLPDMDAYQHRDMGRPVVNDN